MSPAIPVSGRDEAADAMCNEPAIFDEQQLREEEEQVATYIRAYFREELFTALCSLKGQSIGGWTLLSPYAIGGLGALFRVQRGGEAALMKLANLPYDRPAHFGIKEIEHARAALLWEAQVLEKHSEGVLPRFIGLVRSQNLLLTNRPAEVADGGVFLVMEYVPGKPFLAYVQERIAEPDANVFRAWVRVSVTRILHFLVTLKAADPPLFYTDFKPHNIRVSPGDAIRLLDAGSVVPARPDVAVPRTKYYCPQEFRAARNAGTKVERISMTTFGRTLVSCILNCKLPEGLELDFSPLEPILGEDLTQWVKALSLLEFHSLESALHSISRS